MCVLPISNSEFSIVCVQTIPVLGSCNVRTHVDSCDCMLIRATPSESLHRKLTGRKMPCHTGTRIRVSFMPGFSPNALPTTNSLQHGRARARDTRMHAKRACKHAQVCPRKLPEPFKKKRKNGNGKQKLLIKL